MSHLGVKRGTFFELVLIVACAIGLALAVQAWAVKPYQIPSKSMEPTLDVGQRVLVNRIGTHFGDPRIGDILVFHPPTGAERDQCGVDSARRQACALPTDRESDTNFIKRVVAGPGDELSIRDGRPIVNGVEAVEDFARPCHEASQCDFPEPITIPPEHYFMMGDNRENSDDSRFWGPVPTDWIIGEAVVTYWPPDRVGIF
jgi:signal peptidase I